jgi:DNA adenine methylase
MKIGALAPWFGGKRTLAPRIIAELGDHRVYWELFAGGMSVLLNKPPCVMETVNDLHGELINLARVVRDDDLAPVLFDRMSRTLMHEDMMHDAAQRYRARGDVPASEKPDLDRATDYMLCAWLGRNGVAGTSSYNQGFCVRYTANGGHAAKRFQSAVESIPAWWIRLRNVTILNRNTRELLRANPDGTPRIEDRKGTSLYVDPPYVVKGASYVHDFDDAAEFAGLFCGDPDRPMSHAELAESLNRFKKARVVVSYYDHPEVRRLYRGWTFIDCSMTKSLVNQGARSKEGAVKAPEVLIVNGPSLTDGGKWP